MYITKTTSRLFVAALAITLLGSCGLFTGGHGAKVNPGPTATGQQPRPYPEALDPAAIKDIQVFREGTRLRLTNTTATPYGPSTLWINRRFARDIEGFAIGQTLDLDLNHFVDEFAIQFRAGGFFATKKPDPIVIVELETADTPDDAQSGTEGSTQILGLIIVRDEVN